ncbi:MAG: hypothetical protein Kow00127_02960 [Bacteroidales bacterium]
MELYQRIRDLNPPGLLPDDQRTRNKIYVFLVCLGISVFLWFLVTLSDETESVISYPLIFSDVPSGWVLEHPDDTVLAVRVSSSGFALLVEKYLTRHRPLTLSLSSLSLPEEIQHYEAEIEAARLYRIVREQSGLEGSLVRIDTEHLTLKFEALEGRKVPVLPRADISFGGSFQLSEPLATLPDSVWVRGPATVIDTVRFVATQPVKLSDVKTDKQVKVSLVKDRTGILTIEPEEVTLSVKVTEFTETVKQVEISVDGGVAVRCFPGSVALYFRVPVRNWKAIDFSSVRAVVDPSLDDGSGKLPVEVTGVPAAAELLKVEPPMVEYLYISND